MTTTRIVSGGFLAVLIATLVSPARAEVQVGDSPQLKGTAIDGTPIDLGKLRGKLVLIDFWVGRSDLNKNNEKLLIDIHREYGDDGLEIIGVVCDRKIEWARNFVSELKIPWPQIHEPEDWKGGLGKEWGVPRVNWEYLIAPDGKVIYVGDVNKVRGEIESALIKHPPQLVEPAVLAEANRELDDVEKLLADKDPQGAIQKFSRIKDDAMKDRPYAKRYGALRAKITESAGALLDEVDAMIKGKQYEPAGARLRESSDAMSNLPAGSAERLRYTELANNESVKREMELADARDKSQSALTAARTARDSGDAEAAYVKFKAVAQDYPTTPAGKQAAEAVKTYEADEAFMRRMRDHAVAPKAKAALALAENYKSAGQKDKARRKYEEIISEYANTTFADTARRELQKLN